MCTTWILLNVTCDISLALDITLLTVTFVDLPNYDTIVLDAAAAHNSLIIVTESNTQHICKSNQSAKFIKESSLTCAMSCVFLGCTRPSRYWVVEQLYLAFSSADDNQRVRVRTAQHMSDPQDGSQWRSYRLQDLTWLRVELRGQMPVTQVQVPHAIHSRALPDASTSKYPTGIRSLTATHYQPLDLATSHSLETSSHLLVNH